MMSKSICIVFNKAPYGSQAGRELLDIALMAAAFDMPITAIFIGQGVYQLLNNQQPDILYIKNHSATFKALPLYDIEQIFVEQNALHKFNLQQEDLLDIDQLQHVSTEVIKTRIANCDFVITL